MSELKETQPVLVKLKSKVVGEKAKSKSREFEIKQANKLLTMKKSAWELDDAKFQFNGTEIAKVTK